MGNYLSSVIAPVARFEAGACEPGIHGDANESTAKHKEPQTDVDEENLEMEGPVDDDSYVLVLIDLHTHPLKGQPSVIKEKMYTAIIDALPGILPRTRPDSYRIDVRAYVRAERRTPKDIRRMASLVDLSSGRISFAVIAFETITDKDYILRTAEDELADNFAQVSIDPACKHIFFAAWKYPVYLHLLRQASSNVTVVESSSMCAGARKIRQPCSIIQFPEVFATASDRDSLADNYSTSEVLPSFTSLVAKRADPETPSAPSSNQLSQATTASPKVKRKAKSRPSQLRLAGTHPPCSDLSPSHIPVNTNGQRLDYAIDPLRKGIQHAYNTEFKGVAKPCRRYHLFGRCDVGDKCSYGHSALDSSHLEVLQYRAKLTPCRNGSDCQRIDCIYGHVCQNPKCSEEVIKDCPLREFHGVDPTVAEWIKVVEDGDDEEVPAQGSSEEASGAPEKSYWF